MGASLSSTRHVEQISIAGVLVLISASAWRAVNQKILTSPTKNPKVVIVTGASSGMGKDFAIALTKKGHKVYGAARRVEKMQDLVELGCGAIAMDVTKEDQVVACVKEVLEKEGKIDVVINNAGYAEYGPVETTPISVARRQFEVNIFGVARLTQEVIPQMRKQGSGTIINISSMGGKMYTPLGAWYHATKHALEGWSDCLRWELSSFGINVVVIEPGMIKTEFGDVMGGPMMERSKGTPYEKSAQALASGAEGPMSPPSVITKCVVQAIESKRPKTRYIDGSMAKELVFMRTWFGDRIFDSILGFMVPR